ncbi:MAG: hypothetical protein AAF682_22530 [Planctomycetota bacterium]
MTEKQNDLVQRLEKLERENRRMKRWGLAAGGVLGVLGLSSAVAVSPLCKTVWAERFVLKDSSNRTRMTLDAYTSGPPVITAEDASGKTFAKLTLSGETPTLEFFDKKGECSGKIGISEGEPFVESSRTDTVSVR